MRFFIAFSLVSSACLAFMACTPTYYEQPVSVVDESFIHTYGVEVPRRDWTSRGQNGQVITSLNNGVVVTKNFSNGILEGETNYTFPYANSIERREFYKDNVLVKEISFYLSGVPRQEVRYEPNNARTVITWYENGAPNGIEHYNENRLVQGEYHDISHRQDSWVHEGEGMRVVRDSYGQIVSRDTIQKGLMVSKTTYHPNGAPKEIIPYHEGVIEGTKKSFLPAGEPNTIEQWVNGKQNGLTLYFRDGEKYAEIAYVDGHKNGVERHFREGNVVVKEVSWKDGRLHGPSTAYIANTAATDWFYYGKPVSKGNFEILIRSLQETASRN